MCKIDNLIWDERYDKFNYPISSEPVQTTLIWTNRTQVTKSSREGGAGHGKQGEWKNGHK